MVKDRGYVLISLQSLLLTPILYMENDNLTYFYSVIWKDTEIGVGLFISTFFDKNELCTIQQTTTCKVVNHSSSQSKSESFRVIIIIMDTITAHYHHLLHRKYNLTSWMNISLVVKCCTSLIQWECPLHIYTYIVLINPLG